MKIIGVTGGAGSGKTEVLKLLKEKFGAYIIVSDDVARRLSEKGNAAYEKIVRYFGDAVLAPDGELDRAKLAKAVFGRPEKLEALNSFVHPQVRKAILEEIEAAKRESSASCIVIEAALLIEAGYRAVCDELWYVYTDEPIRRRRLKETRHYSDEKIDAVINSQLSEAQFREACDRVIVNNTTLEAVYEQINKFL